MTKKINPEHATPGQWLATFAHQTMHDGSRRPTFAVLATGAGCEQFVGRAHPKSGRPDELPMIETDARLFAASKPMAMLLLRALSYEEHAFDHDDEVSGADLVGWFAAWRVEVRTLLEAAATNRA